MANLPNTPIGLVGKEAVERLRAAGWEIVPREPSEAMIEAGKQVAIGVLAKTIHPQQILTLVYTGVQEWRAMVEAAGR